jgi:hypothetical protein
VSDKCQRHTVLPILPETREWTKEIRNAAGACNGAIRQKLDAQEYNLICPLYCSDGYCRCEMMPRINYSMPMDQKSVSRGGERVFLLSETVGGEKGSYAWTIPRTGTGDMIRFELLSKKKYYNV